MDRGEVDVEEEKSAPVLPTDRERERGAQGHACNVSQLVRGVRGRACYRRKIPTNVQRMSRRCRWWPWTVHSSDVIQALVDAVRGKRGERTMVGKSPKYSYLSNGAVENAVRRIESLTRTCVCVLQEKLAYKVDSKSIVLPWLVRHAACVLSRFVKRDPTKNSHMWTQLERNHESPQQTRGSPQITDMSDERG